MTGFPRFSHGIRRFHGKLACLSAITIVGFLLIYEVRTYGTYFDIQNGRIETRTTFLSKEEIITRIDTPFTELVLSKRLETSPDWKTVQYRKANIFGGQVRCWFGAKDSSYLALMGPMQNPKLGRLNVDGTSIVKVTRHLARDASPMEAREYLRRVIGSAQ